ncbi:nucleotidyltransferase family protein [Catenovulum sp. SM1970]|uniref:nucleotidyltransferase family protein n=1 Tax=Marinifaba aquimaris TaxID=2741323 RepID=UPI001574C1E6|nr:nucleotidyltransferase family protein [Marinifaba aquimaris]NTS77581.1 nucleotidyltransferase family protein [Marinifaba aquimaris]
MSAPSINHFKLVNIVMAAGASQRFGSPKQLAELQNGNGLVINYQMSKLLSLSIPTYLSLGAHAEQIQQALLDSIKCDQFLSIMTCRDWQFGLGHSIQDAVKHVLSKEQPSHIMITLLDQLLIDQDDLAQLITQSQCTPEKITCSQYQNTEGVPAIFPRNTFNQLCQLKADKGARSIIKKTINKTNVSIPNASWDIDTQAQLEKLRPQLC